MKYNINLQMINKFHSGKHAKLRVRKRRDPTTLKFVSCWQSVPFAEGISKRSKNAYLLSSLHDTPSFNETYNYFFN